MKLQYYLKALLYISMPVVSFILTTKFLYGFNSTLQVGVSVLLLLILIIIRSLLIKVENLAKRLGIYYLVIFIFGGVFLVFLIRFDTLSEHPLLKEYDFFPYEVRNLNLNNYEDDLINTKINDTKTEIIFLNSNFEVEMFDIIKEEFYSYNFNSDFDSIELLEGISSFHFFKGNILISFKEGDSSKLVLIDIRNNNVIASEDISFNLIDLIGNNLYINDSSVGFVYTLESDLSISYETTLPNKIEYVSELNDGYSITYKNSNVFISYYYYFSNDSPHESYTVLQSNSSKYFIQITEDNLIILNNSISSSFELDITRQLGETSYGLYNISYPLNYAGENNILIQSDFDVQIDSKYVYVNVGWPLNKQLVYKIDGEYELELYDSVYFYEYMYGKIEPKGFIITDSNKYFLSSDGMHYLEYYEDLETFSHIFSPIIFVIALLSLPLFILGKPKIRDERTNLRHTRSNYDTYKSVNKNKAKKREKW